ncbi:hypothetical protein MUN76_04155 [Leucobacter rhizosphaerae]|uniref:Integral membrane protein n=1 Tax=Leucobacter rhizosphaerae TaxID=2932245 RepID=A0ABY4FY66_9MICO|nr:hypothetical protein [Leucobacter rhizosphaerae]UOQ61171.1 hypothetical protein MUN76_04155 [Leucobacter rhizosphaerae]
MTIQLAAAALATLVLAALAVLQILVASGKPYGTLVWGGQHRILPRKLRIGSAVSVLLYAGFAAILLSRGGLLGGGDSGFVRVATWILVGYFVLGIGMNAISRSRPERAVMTPVCALLAAASLVVALGA